MAFAEMIMKMILNKKIIIMTVTSGILYLFVFLANYLIITVPSYTSDNILHFAILLLNLIFFVIFWLLFSLFINKKKLNKSNSELVKSEEEKSLILDSVPGVISFIDLDFKIKRTNAYSEKIFNIKSENLIGTHCYERHNGQTQNCEDCPVVKTFKTKCSHRTERQLEDGRYVIISSEPVYDQWNRLIGAVESIIDITEQKVFENVLKKSNAQFENLVESNSGWIWEIDKNYKYTYCSKGITEILGYEPQEILGKTLFDLMPKEEADKAIKNGLAVKELVKINIAKNGQRTFLATTYIPLTDNNGNIIGYRGTDKDVTQYRLAQVEIQNSKLFLEKIVNSAPIPMLVKDKDHKFTMLNDACCEFFGLTREQMIGKSDHDFFPKSQADMCVGQDKLVFETGKEFITEENLFDSNGVEHTVIVRKVSFESHNSEKVLIATLQDITENKRAQAEIQSSKQFMEKIINATPIPIFIKDKDHKYTILNDALCSFVGISREEMIGKSDYDFFSKEEADVFWAKDNLVYESKEENINEENVTDVNGVEHKVITKKIAIEAGNSELVLIGIIEDVTQQRQYEEWLKESKDFAEKANKAKSEFLANMSHEIRTPMNGILGFVNLLADTSLNAEQKDFVTEVQKSSELLLSVINDILDISKIEAGKMVMENTCFKIGSVVDDIVTLAKSASSKKSLEIKSFIHPEVPMHLYGDPCRLKQVLNNLVSNSIKFTDKGEILVAVKLEKNKTDSFVLRFEISDTGIGIPQDKLALVFEKFTQADVSTTRQYGGTGLGLSIVQRIVNLMNGEISVSSEEGKGSVFTFTAEFGKNCSSEDEINSKDVQISSVLTDAEIESNSKYKLLLAEDNQVNQKLTVKVLSKFGFVCDVVSNGDEAVNAYKSLKYDLILMDCQMPILDGYQATAEIRKFESLMGCAEQKHVPIIAITANALNGDSEACLAAGMDDYISKPINSKALRQVIMKYLSETDLTNIK